MNNNKTELKQYLKSEYKAISEDFLDIYSNRKNRKKVLKAIRDLIIREREAITIHPNNNNAYSYFLNEYKNHISYERNNIIVPNSDEVRLSLKR